FLRADSVVALAEQGRLEHAEARLELFSEVDADWQSAARLILAWLGAGRNLARATALRDATVATLPDVAPLPLLPLEFGRELVKRISGQAYDQELLTAINSSLMAYASPECWGLSTEQG